MITNDDDDVKLFSGLLKTILDPNASDDDLDKALENIEQAELEKKLPPRQARAETAGEAIALFNDIERQFSREEIDYYLNTFYQSVELARAIAHHPSCPAYYLQKFYIFLPADAEQNPNFEKYSQDNNWQSNINYSRRSGAKPSTWGSSGPGSAAVSEQYPYRYKVEYYITHGSNADKRHIVSLKNIDIDVLDKFVKDKSATIRKAIAERDQMPEHIAEALSNDKAKTVRQALAGNLHTPANLLNGLSQDAEEIVRSAALANPNCPEEAIHAARLQQAMQPSLEDKEMAKLTMAEMIALFNDENTSVDVLSNLALHPQAYVRAAVALHKNTSADVLIKLAEDNATFVQESVAFNPQTPADVLHQLLATKNKDIWRALSNNPSVLEADQLTLVNLGNDKLHQELADTTEYTSVWQALSDYQEAPGKTKKKSKAKSWRDSLKILLNPDGKGLYQLQRGVKTRQLFVAKMIARHPGCPESLTGHYAYYLFDSLAKNPKIALQLLEDPNAIRSKPYADWKVEQWLSDGIAPGHVSNHYLQRDNLKRRRKAVNCWTACISNLQPQVFVDDIYMKKSLAVRIDNTRFMFEMLARDAKPSVRELIAKNKKCPESLLALLATDKTNAVKVAAKQNKNFKASLMDANKSNKVENTQLHNKGPKRDRIKMAKEAKHNSILADLAQDRVYEVREAVAANPKTAAKVLSALGKDDHEKVRLASARNDSTSEEDLRYLFNDPIANVRLSALRGTMYKTATYHKKSDTHTYDEEIFSHFYHDADEDIQRLIARNTTNPDMHLKFLTSKQINVRAALAGNCHLSVENSKILMSDSELKVRHSLLRSTGYEEIFTQLIDRHDDLHEKILDNERFYNQKNIKLFFVNHPSAKIRSYVASYFITDKALLLQLAQDPLLAVRQAVSYNEKLTQAHVDALLEKDINRRLIENLVSSHSKYVKSHFESLRNHPCIEIRRYMAESDELTPKLEQHYLTDESEEVRIGLANNWSGTLSEEAKEQLKNDPSEKVSRALRYNYY